MAFITVATSHTLTPNFWADLEHRIFLSRIFSVPKSVRIFHASTYDEYFGQKICRVKNVGRRCVWGFGAEVSSFRYAFATHTQIVFSY